MKFRERNFGTKHSHGGGMLSDKHLFSSGRKVTRRLSLAEVCSGYDPNGRLVLEPVESTGPATPGVKAAPEFSAAAYMMAVAT